MATFKACVKSQRGDGFWPVYIRVTHNRGVRYLPTKIYAIPSDVGRNNEITNARILKVCSERIIGYNRMLQNINVGGLDVGAVVDLLKDAEEDLSFSDFCEGFIADLINEGKLRTVKNYKAALRSLRLFIGRRNITFRMMTSGVVRAWIDSLRHTARAKEQYPTCMRHVFRLGEQRFNDYEREIIRIRYNPFMAVRIPGCDTPQKRAIDVDDCREFFSAPLPSSVMAAPLEEIGRDVAFLSFCLVGMNTVDMYELRKEDFDGDFISYRRAKSRGLRRDGAFIRIRVEPFVMETFGKYLSDAGDPFLFNFHLRYRSADSFNANVNSGIRKFCRSYGREDLRLSLYSFRHTWATVAQNECGASYPEIGFALNHAKHRGVTESYVKPDFSPIWALNVKVMDFIFFSSAKSRRVSESRSLFRISSKMMICGEAFHNGECVSRVKDIGFGTVDDVISALVAGICVDLPDGARVYFKLRNEDNGETAQYMRTKGKGF